MCRNIFGNQTRASLHKADAHRTRPVVELFITLARSANIYVINSQFNIRVHLLEKDCIFDCIHAAEIGTPGVEALIT